MKNQISTSLRRWITLGVVGATTAAAIAGVPTFDFRDSSEALAQNLSSHPLAGHSIVYVQSGDRWREAFISGISARYTGGQATWQYTVQYLDPQGGTETGIIPSRMTTVETAQSQGLTDTVYDVSTPAGIEQMLAAHNAARREVGLPNLTWSTELAEYAQAWANQLMQEGGTLRHRSGSDQTISNVGENLSSSQASARGGAQQNPHRVVAGWVAEKADYDYASNSCATGKVCGHYTQIVWRETTAVGCGVARNANATREVWVCNYSPAGNYIGERPY